MSLYIFSATESSSLSSNAPTSQQIAAALRLPAQAGRWIGPAPRVTRTNYVTDNPSPWKTTFAWLMEVPPNEVEYNRLLIQNNLSTIQNSSLLSPDWTPVSVVPYSEALNGSIAFWTSGDASRTRTRDDWSTTTDRLLPADNPVGPPDPAVRNPTPGETLGNGARAAGDSLVDLAKGVLVLGLAAGVVLIGVNAFATKIVQKNPTPKRRKRKKAKSKKLAAKNKRSK